MGSSRKTNEELEDDVENRETEVGCQPWEKLNKSRNRSTQQDAAAISYIEEMGRIVVSDRILQ